MYPNKYDTSGGFPNTFSNGVYENSADEMNGDGHTRLIRERSGMLKRLNGYKP